MKVFISWSGERSRYIAETVRAWLPRVIQSVRPWMSDQDISAGSRWLTEMSSELSEARVGLICVTPENQTNPWLLFESGALSKMLDQTHVCPLLFELSPGQLTGPLSQFQAISMDREGMFRIVTTLNKALPSNQLASTDLDEIFDVWWPKLEAHLKDAPKSTIKLSPKRSIEDLLEEIVANTREQLRRETLRLEHSKDRDARVDRVLEMMHGTMTTAQQLQNIPSLLQRVFERNPTPEDMVKLVRSLPSVNVEAMKEMFSQMKELSEKDRILTENLLDAKKIDNPSEGEA